MAADHFRVLVLGLDGATFDLMLPWIAAGHLPNLGKLIDGGARSPLESTIPPITPCAWSSFMTGMNPGKHGLFDFVEMSHGAPTGGSQGFRFTNAACRHGETLWGRLSRAGRRVGVINVPMTYPPEQVNGYLISGMDTPHSRCRFMYPESIRQELADRSIRYHIDIQHLGSMVNDRERDRKLRALCDMETARTDALQCLSQNHPCDFNMVVYTATDQVQHHFWHFMDPRHDQHDAARAKRYGNAIRDVYAHIDGLIGRLLESVDDHTIIVVMSDHGCGPTTNVRLRLNQALEQAGLLAFRPTGKLGRSLRGVAGRLDWLLRSTLSDGAKRLLAGVFPRLRVWFEQLDEAGVDWTRTAAYVNEAFRSNPAVWLCGGQGAMSKEQGAGSGEQGPESLAPCSLPPAPCPLAAAEKALLGMIDPQTGRPVISRVYRPHELYEGPFTEKAPHLIPSWWTDGFLLEQSIPGGGNDACVERSQRAVRGGVEFSGSHRLDGVFAISGGPARRGHVFQGARIIDVAPTILYLMGVPVPAEMDGRPLLEALDPAFVGAHPPRYEAGAAPPSTPAAEASSAFSSEEEELIAQRLRSLGYIE